MSSCNVPVFGKIEIKLYLLLTCQKQFGFWSRCGERFPGSSIGNVVQDFRIFVYQLESLLIPNLVVNLQYLILIMFIDFSRFDSGKQHSIEMLRLTGLKALSFIYRVRWAVPLVFTTKVMACYQMILSVIYSESMWIN